jgi:hypothetical protein
MNLTGLRQYLGYPSESDIFDLILGGDLPSPANGYQPNDWRALWSKIEVDGTLDVVQARPVEGVARSRSQSRRSRLQRRLERLTL